MIFAILDYLNRDNWTVISDHTTILKTSGSISIETFRFTRIGICRCHVQVTVTSLTRRLHGNWWMSVEICLELQLEHVWFWSWTTPLCRIRKVSQINAIGSHIFHYLYTDRDTVILIPESNGSVIQHHNISLFIKSESLMVDHHYPPL